MKNEIIQRLGGMAGGILKEYAGKSAKPEQASGRTSENVTDLIIDQVINALGGKGTDGGGGKGGGRGRGSGGGWGRSSGGGGGCGGRSSGGGGGGGGKGGQGDGRSA